MRESEDLVTDKGLQSRCQDTDHKEKSGDQDHCYGLGPCLQCFYQSLLFYEPDFPYLVKRALDDLKKGGGHKKQENKSDKSDPPVLSQTSQSLEYIYQLPHGFGTKNIGQGFKQF